jgi:hypothetical protein
MRYVTCVVLLLSSLCPLLWADTTLQTEVVQKAVVFLYAADKIKPLGTGFLIMIPSKTQPPTNPRDKMLGVLMLITARHVVDPAWAFCSEPQPDLIYMRVNKKGYDATKGKTGIDYLPVPLRDEKGNRIYKIRDDDDQVDAAIVGIAPNAFEMDEYDIEPMQVVLFANPEEIKALKIGNSVISAGLLPGRSGEKRNYPFFKFGEISNIPDEPTWIGCGGRVELRLERVWFIAATLVGGNSGSPIFYAPPALLMTPGLKRGVIIGLQSSALDGAAIAGMTPIEDVFKIIEQQAPPDMDLYRGDLSQKPK